MEKLLTEVDGCLLSATRVYIASLVALKSVICIETICSTHFTFRLYQRRPLLKVTRRLPETQKIERLLEQLDFVFTFNSFLFTSASLVSPFSDIIPCPVQSFRKASAQNRKQRQVRHLTAGESIKHTCGKKRLNIDRDNTIEEIIL